MEDTISKNKVSIRYQGRTTSIDLRSIVAINHPIDGDKFFKVYFGNSVWNVDISQHDRLYKAWMKV